MLATSHAFNNSTLDLFRLTLTLIESGETNIPTTLKDYFTEILNQAKAIAHDPNLVSNLTKPEAIELAVDVRDIDDFLDQLDQLEGIESVSPEIATQLLKKMEVDSVCQNGFGTFAGLSG